MGLLFDGGDFASDEILMHRPPPSTYDFISQQLHTATSRLTEAGRHIVDKVQHLSQMFEQSEAMRYAKASMRKVRSLWDEDIIRTLISIGELQQAPNVMIPYIMAEPTIRNAYHNQLCDGYGEHYVDVEPEAIGEDHYEYRRVTDGMVMIDEDGNCKATTYIEELRPNEQPLEFEDKEEILTTWDRVKYYYLLGKEDPTSRFNNSLG